VEQQTAKKNEELLVTLTEMRAIHSRCGLGGKHADLRRE